MTDRVLQNFVNGKFTDASDGRTSDVVDPSTGEVYAQAPISSRQDVDAAMQAAANAFEGWRDSTPSERSLALLRFADAVEKRAGEVIEAETRNTGKPVALTASEEIPPAVDQIRFFAGGRDAARGLQALRLRQGPVHVRLRGLHPHQARHELHRPLRPRGLSASALVRAAPDVAFVHELDLPVDDLAAVLGGVYGARSR